MEDKLLEWQLMTLEWRVARIKEDWDLEITRWTLSNYYKAIRASKLKAATKRLSRYTDEEMLCWQ